MPKKTRLSFYENQKIQFSEDLEKVVNKFGIKSFNMEFRVFQNKHTSININNLKFKDSTAAEKKLNGKKVYTQDAVGPTQTPEENSGNNPFAGMMSFSSHSTEMDYSGTIEEKIEKYISLNVKFIDHADFIKNVLAENVKIRSQDPNDEFYQNDRPVSNHTYSIEMKNTQKNPISKSILEFLGENIQTKLEKIKLESILTIPEEEVKPRKVIKI
jgi:hypothetical protein